MSVIATVLRYQKGDLEYYQNDTKIGVLKEDDYRVGDRFIQHPLNCKDSPINGNTRQLVRCIKIKEERLQYAQNHPISNMILSIISTLCLPILGGLWILAALCCAFGGGGPHSPLEGLKKVTERGWNWIRPVYDMEHLQQSIAEDKESLLESIEAMKEKFVETYMEGLKQTHDDNVLKYGTMGWKENRASKQHHADMEQIKVIAKTLFDRDL